MNHFSYQQLQDEQAPWVLHNFGTRPATQPLRGIVEEFGELDAAAGLDDVKDALADIVIFAADYSTAKGWSLEKIMAVASTTARPPWKPSDPGSWTLRNLGKLNHADLKSEQKIRTTEDHSGNGQAALANLLALCLVLARSHGLDLLTITEQTWAKVRLRDWKKNAATAGETPETSP